MRPISSLRCAEATRRWCRAADLMHEHSSKAKLVIATLPSPFMWDDRPFMALLDVMSHEMPPMVRVRAARWLPLSGTL